MVHFIEAIYRVEVPLGAIFVFLEDKNCTSTRPKRLFRLPDWSLNALFTTTDLLQIWKLLQRAKSSQWSIKKSLPRSEVRCWRRIAAVTLRLLGFYSRWWSPESCARFKSGFSTRIYPYEVLKSQTSETIKSLHQTAMSFWTFLSVWEASLQLLLKTNVVTSLYMTLLSIFFVFHKMSH